MDNTAKIRAETDEQTWRRLEREGITIVVFENMLAFQFFKLYFVVYNYY